MPNGRTLEYRLYRVAERFGKLPNELDNIDRTEMENLLAYHEVRCEEETELIINQMKALQSHG